MNSQGIRVILIAFIIVGLLLSTAWFRDSMLLVVILGIANTIGLWILHEWKLIFAYLFAFLAALFAEIFMIYLGVWSYTEVHVVGFPVWLPFLWFSAAVFVGSMIALLRSKMLRKHS